MYVETFYMDREFEKLRILMPGISTLNKTAAADHVPEIEQQIIVIKEQARAIWSTPPFNKILGHIFINIILFVVLWMNAFPPVGGISYTYSPRTIMADFTLG